MDQRRRLTRSDSGCWLCGFGSDLVEGTVQTFGGVSRGRRLLGLLDLVRLVSRGI